MLVKNWPEIAKEHDREFLIFLITLEDGSRLAKRLVQEGLSRFFLDTEICQLPPKVAVSELMGQLKDREDTRTFRQKAQNCKIPVVVFNFDRCWPDGERKGIPVAKCGPYNTWKLIKSSLKRGDNLRYKGQTWVVIVNETWPYKVKMVDGEAKPADERLSGLFSIAPLAAFAPEPATDWSVVKE